MLSISTIRDYAPVTPGAAFPECTALYIGTGGTLVLKDTQKNLVTFTNVPGGSFIPIKATFVDTSSTVSGVVAGYV